jgi:Tol biopolymer transport system component/DNA-binding winged helix-turn-helix (wHTH) protein
LETANGNKNGASTSTHCYVFDGFEIDTENRTLRRDGTGVPLTGKVFDILAVFAENPGRLLEKDELIEKIWHSAFVEEGNLARNVSTLRKALGDTGKDHKYIATVQGRGYRFLADVVKKDGATASEAIEEKASTGISKNENPPDNIKTHSLIYQRPWLISLAGVCLIGAIVVAFRFEGFKLRVKSMPSFDQIRQAKLTQDGNVYGGVISPDGQYLAYVKISANRRALCVRQMATGSVLELQPPHPETSYWATAFAPDNSFLYYVQKEHDADYGNVFRIPLLGGQPHKLASYANGGLTVSPDGRKLAFTRIDRQNGRSAIIVIDNDGGNEQTVGTADLDSMFYSLDWAPDGNSFVYSVKRDEANRKYWYLAEIPATGGTERMIGNPSDSEILMAKWLPDKSGLIVNAVDDATRHPQLYAVSYPDGARNRITGDLNNFNGFSMTADGKSIVVPQINSNRQIYYLPNGNTDRSAQISNGTEKHFDSVTWVGNEYLVFDEDENSSFDNFNIYRMRLDGTDVEQMTFGPGNNTQPAISPDGSTVAFVSSRSGKRQLWKMSMDGRNVTQLTDIPNDVVRPIFAPDGTKVFFTVSVAGQCHIWQVPVSGGTPAPFIDADVYRWAVSPDGAYLAYSAFDQESKTVRTRIQSLNQNKVERVLDISPETWMEWSGDGKALYFNTAKDGAQNMWQQPLDGSKPQPVTAFNNQQVFRFKWSPDGKSLACIRHSTTYDAVMLRLD